MFRHFQLFLLALAFTLSGPAAAQVTVNVDPNYRVIEAEELIRLPPSQLTGLDLHLNEFGDEYELFYEVQGGTLTEQLRDGRVGPRTTPTRCSS